MNIEISLLGAQLKAEGMQDMQMDSVIQGFFHALSGQSKVSGANNATRTQPVIIANGFTATSGGDKKTQQKATTQSISKALPKINGDRTLHTPISELVEEDTAHWQTGIKTDEDGTKRYRCYYWCDCGSKGKRYVPKDAEILVCRDCNQELFIEGATPSIQSDGLPERDNFGNFFIAREAVNPTE
ncbi:hypothetical protein AAGS61_01600 [Lysinibacillus sp. KU-BSD001]|uniref:hypothetical protein n=1 Tax=Lysinibacillus sp. KU-BSD001 TaxID=3141328 RepID=UPI0036E504BF